MSSDASPSNAARPTEDRNVIRTRSAASLKVAMSGAPSKVDNMSLPARRNSRSDWSGWNRSKALKVRCAHPHLERAEGMFNCVATHAHRLRVLIKTLLHGLRVGVRVPIV